MREENIIVKIKYGSHLYGTATKESDLDIKGIFLPQAQNILLQRISPVISFSRVKSPGENNTANDVDYELYSPEKYLFLLAHGQSVALEMLFAPDYAILQPPHPAWHTIKALAPKILTRQAASFVNYCKQQAKKYCLKGARIAAARHVLNSLKQHEAQHGATAKLYTIEHDLRKRADNEYIFIKQTTLANGKQESYLDICGKKALLNASIKNARVIAQGVVDEYGQRARDAERNEGVDWKALMHAVRIGHQAIEYLRYHHITFPRPEATHLLAIKQGKIAFAQVVEEIEQLLTTVESAVHCSSLPDVFDQQLIDDFIEQLHKEQVMKEYCYAR